MSGEKGSENGASLASRHEWILASESEVKAEWVRRKSAMVRGKERRNRMVVTKIGSDQLKGSTADGRLL